MNRLTSLLLTVCVAVPAIGDVVHLKTGATLEGQVVQTDDEVIVKLPAGEVRVSKDAVERIEQKATAFDEYQKRAATLKGDDVEGHYKLGLWAQANGLTNQAKAHFMTAVALDPNHAGARQALGYRLVNGQWMDRDDEMRARGLVQYDGQWMTPEAAGKLKALQAQLEVAREQRLAAEAELERTREEAVTPQAATGTLPVYGNNPYDHYYSTQYLYNRRRYHPVYDYYSVGYTSPFTFWPYSYWRHYPGGYRSISPSRYRRHRDWRCR